MFTLALSAGLMLPSLLLAQQATTQPAGPKAAELAAVAAAQNATWEMGDFLRFTDGGADASSLDTSIVTFVDDQGRRVHLVSAVHIGEDSYYRSLDADFAACEVVLYEMVKPRNAPPPAPGQTSDSGVAQLQRVLKDTLDLTYQLDGINYRRPNFVHADLDAETFAQLQNERGESFATLMLDSLLKAMANPRMGQDQPIEQMSLMDLMTRPDGTRQIKLVLARQFGQIEEEMVALGGPKSVILHERNNAALAALERVLDEGKREVAIFYGAAHMPEIAKAIEAMGFEPAETEWRMAWDLAIRPDAPSAFEQLMRHLGEIQPRQ